MWTSLHCELLDERPIYAFDSIHAYVKYRTLGVYKRTGTMFLDKRINSLLLGPC